MKKLFIEVSNLFFIIGVCLFFFGGCVPTDEEEISTASLAGILIGVIGFPGMVISAHEEELKQKQKPAKILEDCKKELLDKLNSHLSSDEKIEKHVTFIDVKAASLVNEQVYGIAAATNTRIIIYKIKLGGHKIKLLNFNKISAIEYSGGLVFDSLEFSTSGEKLSIDKINKGSTSEFVAYVNSMLK